MEDGLHIIHKALKQNRNGKLIVSVVLILAGLLFIFYMPHFSNRSFYFVRIIGSLSTLSGTALLMLSLIHFDVRKNKLLLLLNKHPEDVVWIYYNKVQMIPFGVKIRDRCTLFFNLRNREKHLINISEDEVQRLVKYLNRKVPRATFGFSREKEQLYLANPDLLINN